MTEGEQQKNYDAMERLPAHRDAEWNKRNKSWYLEYTREYIHRNNQAGVLDERSKDDDREEGEIQENKANV